MKVEIIAELTQGFEGRPEQARPSMKAAAYATELGIQPHLDMLGTRSLALAGRIGAATVKLHPTDVANAGLLDEGARSPAKGVLLGVGGTGVGDLDLALKRTSAKQAVIDPGHAYQKTLKRDLQKDAPVPATDIE